MAKKQTKETKLRTENDRLRRICSHIVRGGGVGYSNINWDSVPLGEFTDQRIANAIGAAVSSVFRERNARGIASRRGRLTAAFDSGDFLGKMTDREVAEKLGTTAASVAAARNDRGIAVFQPEPTAPKLTAVPDLPASSEQGAQADGANIHEAIEHAVTLRMEAAAQPTRGHTDDRLITVNEAARRLSVPDDYVEELIKRGKIAGARLPGQGHRISQESLETFIDNMLAA